MNEPRSLSRVPASSGPLGLALTVLALGTGCAPSIDHLVRTRQHGEALCAATLPGNRATDADRARVVEAFQADAEPQVFLRAITREEIEASLGPRGVSFHRDFVVIVVGLAENHNALPSTTSVRFVVGGKPLPMVDANRAAFAAAFDERIPGDKTIVHQEGRLERLFRAMNPEPGKGAGATAGGMATGVLELLTFGLVPFTQIFPGKKPDTVQIVTPTEAQIRAAAPATMTMRDGLARALAAIPSTWGPNAVLIERPRDGDIPTVQVEQRLQKATKASGTCRATVVFEEKLLPGPSLEDSIARSFPGPTDAPRTGGVRAVRTFASHRVIFPPAR